jgi:hypothetical protein
MTKPRPITPEERAVIRAAKAWEKDLRGWFVTGHCDGCTLALAVRALNAKRAKAKR